MDASAAATPKEKKPTANESGAHSASALAIGAKLKEFVVTGIIGEGGFGIVYSAKDTQLQRNVAIKEYMPAAIANRLASSKINLRSVRHQQTFAAGMQGFIDEARLLAQFKHPALVEILRFWEANDTAYMVMPHYSGKTLRNILKTSRNVCSERWLKSILGPVLDAIELLHSNHVYHRDIAPDNIVIQDTGQPVLLDLGSARRVIAGMQSALTVVVKPGYAPIEQYTEDTANEQGPWTDIYALGAVLYFAISGSAPTASVSRMMRDSLKPLNTDDYPLYSDSFLSSINRALQLRPYDRYQSIADFRDALNIHTSLTGNIALATLTPAGVADLETRTSVQHQDEEITLILSEDEINIFKEKLLQSLHPSTGSVNQKFNANILRNITPTKNDASISSFADVKDLLENTPYITNNKNSRQNATFNETAKTADHHESKYQNQKNSVNVKHTSIHWPIAIGVFVLISIILATVFIVTSNNENNINQKTIIEATDDSYKAKQSDAQKGSQENMYAPSLTQENVSPSTAYNTQLDAKNTEATLFAARTTNFIGQQESPAATEQIDVAADQQPEASTKVEAVHTNQLISESQNGFITDNAQIQNDDIKKTRPTIASNMINTESLPQGIEMGAAKLTLIPWGEIWVNNKLFGVSPPLREILLTPGTYTIELRNPGLPTETRSLTFSKGENPAIYHNFSATKPVTGTTGTGGNKKESTKEVKTEKTKQKTQSNDLKEPSKPMADPTPQANPVITSERLLSFKVLPWGEIFLDGKMVGVTPPLHELKLAPGDHAIEIRHPSYSTKTIKIAADDPATEKIEHSFQ